MPFRSDPGQPRDLTSAIERELRERLEEAVDHVCLEVLVRRRRALGRPEPDAQSAADRAEYQAGVVAFLERLDRALAGAVGAGDQGRLDEAGRRADGHVDRLMARQIALARLLPDYWQRFDAVRVAHAAEPVASGGQRRGWLGRLLGG